MLQLPITAPAAALADAQARQLVEARLQSLQHYQVEFEQQVSDAGGDLLEDSSGRFWLSRPDRFRWEYQLPWPRLILSDGERIWLYDEELEQVTVRDFAGLLEQTPAALLAGRLDVLDGYAVSGERVDDRLLISLVPQQVQSDFRVVELEFSGDDLAEMRLHDSFGRQTRIRFSRVKTQSVNAAEIFEFSVPEGVDVIDESGG